MLGGSFRERQPRRGIARKSCESLSDFMPGRRHKQSGPVGGHGIADAANIGCKARQSRSTGLEIDQAESFPPTGGFGKAGKAEKVACAIEVADLRVGKSAQKANVAIEACRSATQFQDIIAF